MAAGGGPARGFYIMSYNFSQIPATIWGCLSNLRFYRELISRPLRQALIFLVCLAAVPALIWGGMSIHSLNRFSSRITAALRGHLPPLRIDRGEVHMEGEDTFRFVQENEFPVSEWRRTIQLYPRLFTPSPAPREKGDVSPPEKDEFVREDADSEEASREADGWAAVNFPDSERMINSSDVEAKLTSSGEVSAAAAEILRRTSNFGSFVFIVDLTGRKPEFAPGALGFALGKKEYYFNFMGAAIRQPLPEDASMVVNDATLERWRKTIIWQKAPLVVLFLLLVTLVLILIQALLGSLLAAAALSFYKCSLPFRRLFILSSYAIIPPMILIWIFWALHLSVLVLLSIYALIYAVYLIGASKYCCQLD